jgi:hypothetical protein
MKQLEPQRTLVLDHEILFLPFPCREYLLDPGIQECTLVHLGESPFQLQVNDTHSSVLELLVPVVAAVEIAIVDPLSQQERRHSRSLHLQTDDVDCDVETLLDRSRIRLVPDWG